MPDTLQRTQLIGTNDSGDYEYLETYVEFDGENYHEWIVEELPEARFRLWRIHGYPERGIVSYLPGDECGLAELVRAGFADVPRVSRSVG
ncbi:hypothetical protein ACLBXX_00540 [Microbacterium sp. C23T]